MEFQNIVYILLLLIFFLTTLIVNLKRKDNFLSKLKYLFPAMLFSAIIFITWDIRFTELGIWKFNPEFVLGIKFKNIPVEEGLFFFGVPFFSVYIYEILGNRFERFNKPNIFVGIGLVLLLVFGCIAYFFRKNLYPFFTFFLLTVYLGYTIFRNNFKKNYPNFYLSFLFALIPFLLLRGILTAFPVITFDSEHLLNVQIFTVPVEDLAYFFLLHLMNITIFEYLRVRQFY